MTNLKGKTALITGASRGIGEATAREFAKLGANVVLAARSGDAIEKIAADLRNDGANAIAVKCDVANYSNVEAAVNACISNFASIDILINNAGLIDPIARLADSDPEQWGQVVDVNLKGVYYALRAAIPHMEEQGSGTIINISSGAATSALEGWSHYCSTKAAVLSLTQCTHKECSENGIYIAGLSPGTVATNMQVSIKASGINPVSQMDPSVHVPASWPARAIAWLCANQPEQFAGTDFNLNTDENHQLVGLIS